MLTSDDRDRRPQYTRCLSKCTILLLCIPCMLIYIYTYSEVNKNTMKIRNTIAESWKDMMHYDKYVRDIILQVNNDNQILQRKKSDNGNRFTLKMASSNNEKIQRKRIHEVERTDIALLTLFTTWPSKAEKYTCHNNTVTNWLSLRPHVIPILFSNETDITVIVRKAGWTVLPVRRSVNGIPILKSMFLDVVKAVSSHFYAYSNADILFTNQLIETLKAILTSENVNVSNPTMIVGRRTNVMNVTREEASSFENIVNVSNTRGKLFRPDAEDFFITTKNYPWENVPDLLIGRRAYDNWLVLNARKHNFTTIDITKTSLALHQTTKAGNHEGHFHNDTHYNHNLLRKLYKKLRYETGLATCTYKFTNQSISGHIIVENRKKIPKMCLPL